MPRFQIRDDSFGLALVDGEDAREALLSFVADLVKSDVRPTVTGSDDGVAEVVYAGVRYRAVPAAPADARAT
jgi:hypothetical protein